MSGTILFVDDSASWYEAVSDLLEDEYTVVWAKNKMDAISKLEAHDFDLIITNLNLKPNFPVLDGDGYSLLEVLKEKRPEIPRIVLSALKEPATPSAMAEKVSELYSFYKVKHVAIKGGDKFSNKLVHEIKEILTEKSEPVSGGKKSMNWEDTVRMLVSAMTPYAVALGTSTVSAFGTKFGDAVYDNFKKVWDWMQGNIEQSGGDADKKLWEDFKNVPKDHQEPLIKTMLRIVPTEELEIRRQAETLLQETYRLLDNYDIFTLQDLKRICSRLSIHWENEVPNPTSEALSRWAVKYARTRHKEAQLVAAIFEINPDALPK